MLQQEQDQKHQKQIQSQMPFETDLQQVHINQEHQEKYEQKIISEVNNSDSLKQKESNVNQDQKQPNIKKERVKDKQEQDDITPIEVLQIPASRKKQQQQQQFMSTFQQLKRADSSERLEQKLIIYPDNYENWTQQDCEEIVKQDSNNIFRRYKLVQIFLSNHEFSQAKEQLQKVSQLDPDFEVEQVNFHLGEIFMIEKQWGKALQHLRVAYQFMQDRGKCLMAMGRCYGKLRDLDKAILKYKKAIECNNKDSLGYYRLGWLLIKNKKMREGIDNLAKAQTLDSTNLEIIIKLGNAYIIENQLDEAVQVLHQGISIDPLNYDCMNALARGYEKQGDLQNAIHYAKQATQQPNANINSHYYLGMLYMKKKDLKLAAESFRTLLKIDCEHVDALIEYATISSIQGNYEKAKKYLKHALKLQPNHPIANMRLGRIFQTKLKDYNQAIDCFVRVCRSDQNNYKAHYYMGQCYIEKKDYNRATDCMKESLKINQKFGMAWKIIGSLQYERNQPGKALKYFQKALDSDPLDLEAKIGLGNCFYLQEQFEQAIQIYEEISRFDQNEELEYNLANCYYMKNDLDSAIIHYQNALEVNSKKVECRYNLGNSYFIQEKYEEALDEFKKVIDLDSKHGAALYNYANTFYILENYEKAAENFEKAISVQPRNVEWRNYVANLYMEKGDLEKAKSHLDESYKLDQKNAETLMRMSNYYYQIGNYREAIKYAKNCLAVDEHNQEAHDLIQELTK